MISFFHERITYTPPRYEEGTVPNLFAQETTNEQMLIIIVNTRFLVSKIDVDGYIMMLFEFSSLENIFKKIAKLGESGT